MNNEKLIEVGIRKAQEIARKKGLNIGSTVAHPTDKLMYKLYGVENGVATVGLNARQSPLRKAIKKVFPVDELFDPNIARDQALAVRDEELARLLPSAIVCRLGK